ncbi:MAG: type secretion system protein [Phycisphaerales bacterium]|nr:type secretion system protein [Phycisphaerales bacterium]MDB5355956.1 type secretion system protein [Phycisphaerales bacterium]
MRRKAFTLPELLVVIGIIALLLAILMPSLRRARQSARSVTCASNARQVVLSMLMYANDNQGYLPTASEKGLVWSNSQPGWIAYFYPANEPAPGIDIEFDHGAFMEYLGHVGTRQSVLRCVEAELGTANYSYVLPAQLGDTTKPLVRLVRIPNSSRKIILVEMDGIIQTDGIAQRFDGHFNIGEGGADGDEPADHHMKVGTTGYGNHGFADGHIESLSRADIDDVRNRDRFDY